MPFSGFSLLVPAFAILLFGCGKPQARYLPVPDGGIALIFKTSSTNTNTVDVIIYPDGSAVRSVGEDGGYWAEGSFGGPTVLERNYPPHSPEIEALIGHLAAVEDVSDIPIFDRCAKSISFGTYTLLSANGHVSGDLQCVDSPSDEQQALVEDCLRLTALTWPDGGSL